MAFTIGEKYLASVVPLGSRVRFIRLNMIGDIVDRHSRVVQVKWLSDRRPSTTQIYKTSYVYLLQLPEGFTDV